MKEYGKLSHLNTCGELGLTHFIYLVGLLIEHMTNSCFFHSTHVYWVPTLIVYTGLGAGNNGWVKHILALLDFNQDLLCLMIGPFLRIIFYFLELVFLVTCRVTTSQLWSQLQVTTCQTQGSHTGVKPHLLNYPPLWQDLSSWPNC